MVLLVRTQEWIGTAFTQNFAIWGCFWTVIWFFSRGKQRDFSREVSWSLRSLWKSLKSHEVLWSLVESLEVFWSLEVSGSLLESREVLWSSLKSLEVFSKIWSPSFWSLVKSFEVRYSHLSFSLWMRGLRKKIRSTIDRARRDLSGTIIHFVVTGIEANPFQKYSNPDLRFLTYCSDLLIKKKIMKTNLIYLPERIFFHLYREYLIFCQ